MQSSKKSVHEMPKQFQDACASHFKKFFLLVHRPFKQSRHSRCSPRNSSSLAPNMPRPSSRKPSSWSITKSKKSREHALERMYATQVRRHAHKHSMEVSIVDA